MIRSASTIYILCVGIISSALSVPANQLPPFSQHKFYGGLSRVKHLPPARFLLLLSPSLPLPVVAPPFAPLGSDPPLLMMQRVLARILYLVAVAVGWLCAWPFLSHLVYPAYSSHGTPSSMVLAGSRALSHRSLPLHFGCSTKGRGEAKTR